MRRGTVSTAPRQMAGGRAFVGRTRRRETVEEWESVRLCDASMQRSEWEVTSMGSDKYGVAFVRVSISDEAEAML